MKQIVLLWVLQTAVLISLAQTPIVLIDKTFKLKANHTEELYFSFAAGDHIVIDFNENNNKTIKQIEVTELPSSTKFSSINISTLSAKTIHVHKKGVYQFKITSPALGSRECHVTISRIPQSEATTHFNTDWQWATVYDTTYKSYTIDSLIGYENIPYIETTREVTAREQREELLVDRIVEVRSYGIINHDNPREFVTITLPQNRTSHIKEEQVVSWAYYIGVNDNSHNFLSRNKSSIQQAARFLGNSYSILGGYAAGVLTDLVIPDASKSDNVQFAIVPNILNRNNFMQGAPYRYIQQGNVTADKGRFTNNNLQGEYYLCLYNDNIHDRINVYVQVVAIIETTYFQDVQYERVKVEPKYVTLTKRKMSVSSQQVRVPVE